MLTEGATAIPALMQSTPLIALRGADNVFQNCFFFFSPHLEDDIVDQMEWAKLKRNNGEEMQWP